MVIGRLGGKYWSCPSAHVGGSTIVLLFEEGKMVFDDDLVDNSNGALETLVCC